MKKNNKIEVVNGGQLCLREFTDKEKGHGWDLAYVISSVEFRWLDSSHRAAVYDSDFPKATEKKK